MATVHSVSDTSSSESSGACELVKVRGKSKQNSEDCLELRSLRGLNKVTMKLLSNDSMELIEVLHSTSTSGIFCRVTRLQ